MGDGLQIEERTSAAAAPTAGRDPERSLAWVARQRIGGPQNVRLVVSTCYTYGLRGGLWTFLKAHNVDKAGKGT